MKKSIWISWVVALMCVAPASAYYEDFEDPGNLQGTLLNDGVVSGGELRGHGEAFMPDGDYPDASGYMTVNFGGYDYEWRQATYTFGRDETSFGYADAPAGIMVWWLPWGAYTSPNGWMYVLRNDDDPDTVWQTIFIDQSGAVNPAGYSDTTDYVLHVEDHGDSITTWVEEADNPANKGMVYEVDITGEIRYGNKISVGINDSTLSTVGIKDLVIGTIIPVTVTHTDGQTEVAEKNETTDSFDVVLEEQPTDTVTVTLDPQTADVELNGAGPNNPVTLTFGTADWDTSQTVTVKAEDDAEAEGQENVLIVLSSASTDTAFVGGFNVSATVIDDDQEGVGIEDSDGSTDVAEGGMTTDTYEVVLFFAPNADVTITIDDASEPNQVLINGGDAAILTFTAANWDTPQTVTFKAIDDANAEDHPHHATLTHTATQAGGNQNYDDIAIDNVGVEIAENDCGAGPFDDTDFTGGPEGQPDCITDLLDFAYFTGKYLNCTIGSCI